MQPKVLTLSYLPQNFLALQSWPWCVISWHFEGLGNPSCSSKGSPWSHIFPHFSSYLEEPLTRNSFSKVSLSSSLFKFFLLTDTALSFHNLAPLSFHEGIHFFGGGPGNLNRPSATFLTDGALFGIPGAFSGLAGRRELKSREIDLRVASPWDWQNVSWIFFETTSIMHAKTFTVFYWYDRSRYCNSKIKGFGNRHRAYISFDWHRAFTWLTTDLQ